MLPLRVCQLLAKLEGMETANEETAHDSGASPWQAGSMKAPSPSILRVLSHSSSRGAGKERLKGPGAAPGSKAGRPALQTRRETTSPALKGAHSCRGGCAPASIAQPPAPPPPPPRRAAIDKPKPLPSTQEAEPTGSHAAAAAGVQEKVCSAEARVCWCSSSAASCQSGPAHACRILARQRQLPCPIVCWCSSRSTAASRRSGPAHACCVLTSQRQLPCPTAWSLRRLGRRGAAVGMLGQRRRKLL